MKKLSILFLFIIFFLVGCTKEEKKPDTLSLIKERGKIIIGVKNDSKPFGFIKDGKYQGFDIDIAHEISKNIFIEDNENHIEFVPLKPTEKIFALNDGKVDIIIAALSVNEKRKQIIDFSKPYHVTGQTLMLPIASKILTIEQLNGKNIAVVLGTTGEKTGRMLVPNANLIGTTNYNEALKLLSNGTVQAILADESLLYGLLADNKRYKILNSRYTEEYYAIGIRQGEENTSLKNKINNILDDMQTTGKLNRIKEKWLGSKRII